MRPEQVERLGEGLVSQTVIAKRAGVTDSCICRRARVRGIEPTAVRWRLRLYTEEQAARLLEPGKRGGPRGPRPRKPTEENSDATSC